MSGMVWFLALVGFCLVAAEIVLPGAILGILGGVCLLSAVVMAFATGGVAAGVTALILISIGTTIGFVIWLKTFSRSTIGRQMTLQSTISSPQANALQPGQTGEALSALRPAGTALIQGRKVDVVTAGDFIEAGTPVEIQSVSGMRVVVRTKDS